MKIANFKTAKIITFNIIVAFSFLFLGELFLRIKGFKPKFKKKHEQFDLYYKDIFNPFFKKIKEDGDFFYISQKKIGGMRKFPVKKSSDIRIFIVGGSVAAIFGVEFEYILESFIEGYDFEVINCGVGGYDSFRTQLVVKEIVNYDPDLIVVLSGNNEYYPKSGFNINAYYIDKFLKKSYIYCFLQNKLKLLYPKKDNLLGRSKKKRLLDYKKNIKRIIKIANKNNIPIMLSTLPFAMKDYPPKGSSLLVDDYVFKAKLLLDQGHYSQALEMFKEISAYFPNDSIYYYLAGVACEKKEDYNQAKRYYLKAVDVSAEHWLTANPKSNQVIRDLCIDKNIGLADLEKEFMAIAENGIIGRKQLYDNCHWYNSYNFLVANVVAKEMLNNEKISNRLFDKKPKVIFLSKFKEKIGLFRDKNAFNRQFLEAVWTILESKRLEPYFISLFDSLYFLDSTNFSKIDSFKNKVRAELMNSWTCDYIDNNKDRFDKKWPQVLYCVAEVYRRNFMHKKALYYYNKAIDLDDSNYMFYLGRAVTYYLIKDDSKAQKDINRAEQISEEAKSVSKVYNEYFSNDIEGQEILR